MLDKYMTVVSMERKMSAQRIRLNAKPFPAGP